MISNGKCLLLALPMLWFAIACGNDERGSSQDAARGGEEVPTIDTPYDDCGAPLPWQDASKHDGENIAVQGPVLEVTGSRDNDDLPEAIFVEVGTRRPDERGIDVVISKDLRDLFRPVPEILYEGRSICARGPLEVVDGRARIFPGVPQDIQVVSPFPQTPQVPGGYCNQPIPWTEAARYSGGIVDVEGQVVGTRQEENVNGVVLLLELGAPLGEGSGFDVAIEASNLENFDPNPSAAFMGQTICVQGGISIVGGRPRTYVATERGVFVR